MKLKELSSLLGLSQTTVSRALNGYPEVNAETRERVMEAARRHGYAPNLRAKNLATGRAGAIGHVIATRSQSEVMNPIFADFIAGAGAIYRDNDVEMILSITDPEREEDVYRGLKARQTVDGVILHGPRMNDPRIALLQEIGLPFVVHGRASGIETPYSWIDVNNRSAFRRSTGMLIDLGHERIALINGNEKMDFAHRRRQGYEDSITAAGFHIDPRLLSSGDMTEANGYANARELLASPQAPTAFLVASVIQALGVRRAIDDAGHALGVDVSVVCFDDCLSYLSDRATVPLFTAARSSVHDAGRQAAAMLLDQINAPDQAPCTRLLEADLTLGKSTGPAQRRRFLA